MKLSYVTLVPLVASLVACNTGQQEAPSAPAPPAAAAASTPTAAASAPPTSVSAISPAADALVQARYTGFGDMRFGMDETAFRHAWGGELKGPPTKGMDCFYLYPKWVKTPPETAFMFEHGHFVRYDITTVKETAPGGGKVGMTKAEILSLYGASAKEQPDKYDPAASSLRIEGTDGGVLLFQIGADGKVSKWRVGNPPQVDYVEGCS